MSKIGICYFSVYGSTKTFAEEISSITGGDLFRIIPYTRYDDNKENYEILTKLAQIEKENNERPMVEKIDISPYEIIFVGYPIWWYTMPMAVYTFLENQKWQGKTVIPFCTHEGSRESDTYETFRKICKGATVLDGLAIPGTKFKYSQTIEIGDWLEKLGLK